jgi:cytochrome c oxidase cbb3-type subunit 3
MRKLALVLAVAALATPALAADGKEIFAKRCVACHGADGKGTSTMAKKLGVKDLTVTKLSAAQIEEMVTKGKGKMTPFGTRLSPEEIKAVAAFVKGGLK